MNEFRKALDAHAAGQLELSHLERELHLTLAQQPQLAASQGALVEADPVPKWPAQGRDLPRVDDGHSRIPKDSGTRGGPGEPTCGCHFHWRS